MRLSHSQTDLLRQLCRQRGPVPTDHLDGRVVRALESRRLVQTVRGWTSPTEEGRARFAIEQKAPVGKRRRSNQLSARAQKILAAVAELEQAIPVDAEVDLVKFPAYIDDVLEGLRRYARAMG